METNIAFFSIVFGILWSIQIQLHQDKWQKKVETLHSLEARDRSHMPEILKKIKNVNDGDSLLNLILSDSMLEDDIHKQMVIFEDLSIGYNINVYDGKVMKKFMGTSFIRFNEQMQPYILYIRKKYNNPNVYSEYDKCVQSLSGKKKR